VAAVRCAGGAHILEPVADRAVLERQPVDTHGHVRLVGALGGVDRVRVRKVVERLAAVARAEEERLGGGPGVGARARADRLRVVRAVHLQIRLVHPLEQQHCAARLGRLRARRERGAVELDGRVDDGGEMGERRVEVAQLQLAPAAPVVHLHRRRLWLRAARPDVVDRAAPQRNRKAPAGARVCSSEAPQSDRSAEVAGAMGQRGGARSSEDPRRRRRRRVDRLSRGGRRGGRARRSGRARAEATLGGSLDRQPDDERHKRQQQHIFGRVCWVTASWVTASRRCSRKTSSCTWSPSTKFRTLQNSSLCSPSLTFLSVLPLLHTYTRRRRRTTYLTGSRPEATPPLDPGRALTYRFTSSRGQ
jgi:hypothetical protein